MDLEMNKKQLEERVTALEEEIKELKSQLLTLALRPVVVTAPPISIPAYPPVIPTPQWLPHLPYIGDLPGWQGNGTITSATPNISVRNGSLVQ